MATRTPPTDDSNEYDTTVIERSGNTHFDTEKHRIVYVPQMDEYMLFVNDNADDGVELTVFFDEVIRRRSELTPRGYRFKRNGMGTAHLNRCGLTDDMIDFLESRFFDT